MPSKFWGRLADAFIPGNAYNSTTGRWNPATTKVGIAGLLADQLIPGGSNIVGMAGRGGLFGNDFATDLRNEGIYNTMADQYGEFKSGLQEYLNSQRPEVGGYNPQVSLGTPQTVSTGIYAPTLPAVNVQGQGPWTGLGTQSGDLFNGGMLGSWASGGGQQTAPSVAQQATGGASMGGGHGQGWTGVSGAAAQSMFSGMRDSSNAALAEAEMAAMRRQKQ